MTLMYIGQPATTISPSIPEANTPGDNGGTPENTSPRLLVLGHCGAFPSPPPKMANPKIRKTLHVVIETVYLPCHCYQLVKIIIESTVGTARGNETITTESSENDTTTRSRMDA